MQFESFLMNYTCLVHVCYVHDVTATMINWELLSECSAAASQKNHTITHSLSTARMEMAENTAQIVVLTVAGKFALKAYSTGSKKIRLPSPTFNNDLHYFRAVITGRLAGLFVYLR